MDQIKFVRAMKARRLLGITIVSHNHVCSGVGFTGTYKHVYGANIREEIDDATVLAIAEELKAMQGASRLLIGKFFYASMNIAQRADDKWKMIAEIFYDEQFVGEDYKKEIHEQFLGLMRRFTEWMEKEGE